MDPERFPRAGELRKQEEAVTDVLVIGGGPAGMNAALEAAAHGLKVIILERNARMGG
ncbi:MAG: FAD-dependent oxidoreductase, partial [Stomatobaculum sp.]|nr:FAD-dependent oxidoreductase [Stomatobaculum sp.]